MSKRKRRGPSPAVGARAPRRSTGSTAASPNAATEEAPGRADASWLERAARAPGIAPRLARGAGFMTAIGTIFSLLGVAGFQVLVAALVAGAGGLLVPSDVRTILSRASLAAALLLFIGSGAYGVTASVSSSQEVQPGPEEAVQAWLALGPSSDMAFHGDCAGTQAKEAAEGWCWSQVDEFRPGELYRRRGITATVGEVHSDNVHCVFVAELNAGSWRVEDSAQTCEMLGEMVPAPDAPIELHLRNSGLYYLGECRQLLGPNVTPDFQRRAASAPSDAVCARPSGVVANTGLHLFELVRSQDVADDEFARVPVVSCLAIGRDSPARVWAVRDQESSCTAIRSASSATGGLPSTSSPPRIGGPEQNWLDEVTPLSCFDATTPLQLNDLTLGDVTGDGRDEIFVAYACESTTSSWPEQLEVFTISDSGQPVRMAELYSADDRSSSYRGLRLEELSVKVGTVAVVATGWSAENVPGCCPDLRVTQTFEFMEGRLDPGPRVEDIVTG
jgi:hypothetical protein